MKLTVNINDLVLNVNCTNSVTTIYDSYKVKNWPDMYEVLSQIQAKAEGDKDLAIHKRTMLSMIREWRTHNLLYSFGLYKPRTKDVDLNLGQPVYVKIAYALISPLYLHWV